MINNLAAAMLLMSNAVLPASASNSSLDLLRASREKASAHFRCSDVPMAGLTGISSEAIKETLGPPDFTARRKSGRTMFLDWRYVIVDRPATDDLPRVFREIRFSMTSANRVAAFACIEAPGYETVDSVRVYGNAATTGVRHVA